jgi:hypothetical protein
MTTISSWMLPSCSKGHTDNVHNFQYSAHTKIYDSPKTSTGHSYVRIHCINHTKFFQTKKSLLRNILNPLFFFTMLCGSLVTTAWHHGASSGCGWRRWPPDMEGSCEHTDLAVADSRQGWSSSSGVGRGAIVCVCACVYVWSPFQLLNQQTDFHEIWYECHAIGCQRHTFWFPTSIITQWWMYGLVWQRH